MTGQHDAGFTRIAPTPGYLGRHRRTEEPDDPARCWSCGHTTDMFCECQCCDDDHDGSPDDV